MFHDCTRSTATILNNRTEFYSLGLLYCRQMNTIVRTRTLQVHAMVSNWVHLSVTNIRSGTYLVSYPYSLFDLIAQNLTHFAPAIVRNCTHLRISIVRTSTQFCGLPCYNCTDLVGSIVRNSTYRYKIVRNVSQLVSLGESN